MLSKSALAFASFLVLSLAATKVAVLVARRYGILDLPDERKVHLSPVPRNGGLAIYASLLLATVWQQNRELRAPFLIGSSLIFLVGLADDLVGLRAKVKLIFQILSSLLAAAPLMDVGVLEYALGALWLLSMSNAYNLIDGVDGLSLSLFAVSSATLWVTGSLNSVFAASMLGMAAGVLFYNKPKAAIFLGDSGSLLLGFTMGWTSGISALGAGVSFDRLVWLLAFGGVPMLDLAFAVVRRAATGRHIFSPDRGHIHHRLMDLGLTHPSIVLILSSAHALLHAALLIWKRTSSWGMS